MAAFCQELAAGVIRRAYDMAETRSLHFGGVRRGSLDDRPDSVVIVPCAGLSLRSNKYRDVAGALAVGPFDAPKAAGIIQVAGHYQVPRALICHAQKSPEMSPSNYLGHATGAARRDLGNAKIARSDQCQPPSLLT
jgi:hypothetical protein